MIVRTCQWKTYGLLDLLFTEFYRVWSKHGTPISDEIAYSRNDKPCYLRVRCIFLFPFTQVNKQTMQDHGPNYRWPTTQSCKENLSIDFIRHLMLCARKSTDWSILWTSNQKCFQSSWMQVKNQRILNSTKTIYGRGLSNNLYHLPRWLKFELGCISPRNVSWGTNLIISLFKKSLGLLSLAHC